MKSVIFFAVVMFLAAGCQEVKDKQMSSPITNKQNLKKPDTSGQGLNGQYPKGIDIHDSNIVANWNTLKTEGISFAFIKATEGETYLDTLYQSHWKGASNANLTWAPYHFYHYNDDPENQAKFFIQTVKSNYTVRDLPPVIDIETLYDSKGNTIPITNVTSFQKGVQKWLTLVEEGLNKRPIIYVSTDYANEYLNNDIFSKYSLWVANYNDEPVLPNVWKEEGWSFWQYKGNTTLPGVSATLDLDYFNGTLQELKTQ
ncbi:MAG: hypothetical protein K0U54_11275 [Bacteroidetes bacterium]|nr:hypothetical protein [Bacteroidota bacterium]